MSYVQNGVCVYICSWNLQSIYPKLAVQVDKLQLSRPVRSRKSESNNYNIGLLKSGQKVTLT
jgi:hypothetical protein